MSFRSVVKRSYFLASMRWHVWREQIPKLARRAAIATARAVAAIALGTGGVSFMEHRGWLRFDEPSARVAPAVPFLPAKGATTRGKELRRAALADSSLLVVPDSGQTPSSRMLQRPSPGTRALSFEEGSAESPPALEPAASTPERPRAFVRAKNFIELAFGALTGRFRIDPSKKEGALRRFDGLPFGDEDAPTAAPAGGARKTDARRRNRTDLARGPSPERAPRSGSDPLALSIRPPKSYAKPLSREIPGSQAVEETARRRLAWEAAEARRAYWLALARRLGAGAALSLAAVGLSFVLSGVYLAFRPWGGGRDQ